MNKAEFIAHIADNYRCSKVEAERAVNIVTESLISALGQGDSVNLIGFGSFEVQKRAAREGRNPKTGEPLKIAAYNQPSFKAGKSIKDACNGKAAPAKEKSNATKSEDNDKKSTATKAAAKKK